MKKWIIGITVVLVIIAFALTASRNRTPLPDLGTLEIFKTPTCGCCGLYAQYMQGRNAKVLVTPVNDLSSIREDLGVPANLQSCHTMQIGKYFVEGHIPSEAIAKLVTEQPDIKGIAMPGMPSGSPGMPGAKRGDFVIYAVNNDGSYEEFMRL